MSFIALVEQNCGISIFKDTITKSKTKMDKAGFVEDMPRSGSPHIFTEMEEEAIVERNLYKSMPNRINEIIARQGKAID